MHQDVVWLKQQMHVVLSDVCTFACEVLKGAFCAYFQLCISIVGLCTINSSKYSL